MKKTGLITGVKTLDKINSIIYRSSTFDNHRSMHMMRYALPYKILSGDNIGSEESDRLIVNFEGGLLGEKHNRYDSSDLVHVDDLGLTDLPIDDNGDTVLWDSTSDPTGSIYGMNIYRNRLANLTNCSRKVMMGNRQLVNPACIPGSGLMALMA